MRNASSSAVVRAARAFAALSFAGALVVACGGSSSSSQGAAVGSACSNGAECAGGVCATSADFPQGYCTQGCKLTDPSTCPAGSVCIDDASGVPADAGVSAICYQRCQTTADCSATAGFQCLEKSSQLVCRHP